MTVGAISHGARLFACKVAVDTDDTVDNQSEEVPAAEGSVQWRDVYGREGSIAPGKEQKVETGAT